MRRTMLVGFAAATAVVLGAIESDTPSTSAHGAPVTGRYLVARAQLRAGALGSNGWAIGIVREPEAEPIDLQPLIDAADPLGASLALVAEAVAEPAPETIVEPAPEPEPAPLPNPRSGYWPNDAQWYRLRICESTDNPRAVSPGGWYRGHYQFDFRTWYSVGGVGDPIDASPEEQLYRAQLLYAQRGAEPWPVCGRFLY